MHSSEEEAAPLIQGDKQTYKSRQQVTFMVLNIALSSFYFGYTIAYFGQLNIETILGILDY